VFDHRTEGRRVAFSRRDKEVGKLTGETFRKMGRHGECCQDRVTELRGGGKREPISEAGFKGKGKQGDYWFCLPVGQKEIDR